MNQLTRPHAASGDLHAKPLHHLPRLAATRILHLLLLVAVLHQLASSEFMQRPSPGDPPSLIFRMYAYLGIVSTAVIAGFWAWTLMRRGETRPGHMVPWFSIGRMRDVMQDLTARLCGIGRLRFTAYDSAMTSAIHGLGLLAVTRVALSGCVSFFTPDAAFRHTALTLHKTLSNAVWIYLFVHAGAAILHHLLGSDIFSRIFWQRRR